MFVTPAYINTDEAILAVKQMRSFWNAYHAGTKMREILLAIQNQRIKEDNELAERILNGPYYRSDKTPNPNDTIPTH